MIKFSLKHILEHSPYELALSGDEFMFQTDLGIHYSISFSKEDIVLGGCDTYQLIIRKIEEVKSQHDSKVEATIQSSIPETAQILLFCTLFPFCFLSPEVIILILLNQIHLIPFFMVVAV